MKILVCGGREFCDQAALWGALDAKDKVSGPLRIVTGGQRKWDGRRWLGADYLAEEWARKRGRWAYVLAANWDGFGLSAGPRRNQQMLDEAKPHEVLAAPGGTGTADMVRRAREAGLHVTELTEGLGHRRTDQRQPSPE